MTTQSVRLTAEQLMVTVLVASAIVQFVKVVYTGLLKRPKPSPLVLQILSFVVSVALAYFWRSPVALPDPTADPAAFALALITGAGELLVFSHLVYEALLKNLWSGLSGVRGAGILAP